MPDLTQTPLLVAVLAAAAALLFALTMTLSTGPAVRLAGENAHVVAFALCALVSLGAVAAALIGPAQPTVAQCIDSCATIVGQK